MIIKIPFIKKRVEKINFLQIKEGEKGLETVYNPKILNLHSPHQKQILVFLRGVINDLIVDIEKQEGDKK